MEKVVLHIFTFLLLAVSLSAQIEEKSPILIDEFGEVNSEEIALRLDGLIFELSKYPSAKAIIRMYAGNKSCFLCGYREGSGISAYLKNTRKVSSEKYSIEYCHQNTEKEHRVQLFLLTPKAELPKCEKNLEVPKNSALFDKVYFYYKDNKLVPLENIIIDVVAPAHGEYSLSALRVIKDNLNNSPENKIYIIVYLGTNPEYKLVEKNGETIEKTSRNLDKKSLAKKMLLNAKDEFIKNGINPSQIEIINGGYVDDKRRLEFWFVPKGGDIPQPKPDYFPEQKNRK